MTTKIFLSIAITCLLFGCSQKEEVDLVVHNGVIYTVDSAFSVAEAFAVKDGKFVAIGTSEDILSKYQPKKKLDARQKSIYPGFYDGHCHFFGLAKHLDECDLVGTHSVEEMISYLKSYSDKHHNKTWLVGRGWDQNDWTDKNFPSNKRLDEEFPNIPVFLVRVDGHAALANTAALKAAGVTTDSKIAGGLVEIKNGKLTGILVDNAMSLVSSKMPETSDQEMRDLLHFAEKQCLSHGLTTVSDAGLNKHQIDLIDKMQKEGKLKIRVYAMVDGSDDESRNYYLNHGIYKTDRLNVRSFKIYADGALGSRGACLLAPYEDAKTQGFLLTPAERLKQLFEEIAKSPFQANTHCIGDSANRLVLNLYGEQLKGKNDRRWRIEHAQVVDANDISKFGQFSVLPSVQPTHATSDMPWAEARLGASRVKTAYAFKDLYEQNKMIVLGSDFPVEALNPVFGFHAAVARQNGDHEPENGFQIENALDKEMAIRGMTQWAAYANFEEKERGSIQKGKFADFVILNTDLIETHPRLMRLALVLDTFIGGEKVYDSKRAHQ